MLSGLSASLAYSLLNRGVPGDLGALKRSHRISKGANTWRVIMLIRTPLLTSAVALSLAGLTFVGLSASAAFASEDHLCSSAPRAEWRSADEAKAAVEAEGYTVTRIKTEDGCYEAYARDAAGARYELLLDPVTLAIVGQENDD